MSTTDRNAALWYQKDAYDPVTKGLNGRRVAGESFLRGYLRYAEADEFRSVVMGPNAAQEFSELTEPYRKGGLEARSFMIHQPDTFSDIGTVFYPSPGISSELWRRYRISQTAYSICGITHTTATKKVMNGIFEMLTAPCEPWDGLICTSHSVHEQINYQLDLYYEYQVRRMGFRQKRRFNTTMIPLGIHTDEFKPHAEVRRKFRTDKGISDDDVCFLVISRLSVDEKFDPIPLYLALQKAAKRTKRKLNLILCGYYPDKQSEQVFIDGAKKFMPDVGFYKLDGKNAAHRRTALSIADVFTFPIDNVQETFGLAPVEAMAAGLPIVCSDWDGMKDTVTPDVGIRVKTRFPVASQLVDESDRYRNGVDNYRHYTTLLSQMTQINVQDMAMAFLRLAENPTLRIRMGEAGKRRARTKYDWSVVIPQMQDYWEELGKIRRAAPPRAAVRYKGLDVPSAPNAGNFFASYPTEQTGLAGKTLVARNGISRADIYTIYQTRSLDALNRVVQPRREVENIFDHISGSGGTTTDEIGQALDFDPLRVERSVLVLLKYDLIYVKEDHEAL